MANKKAGGSTRNGRDSNPKYLGVKRYGGQDILSGNLLFCEIFIPKFLKSSDPHLP